jgi:hypothetical protein
MAEGVDPRTTSQQPKIAVVTDDEGRVCLSWDEPINWLTLTQAQAIELGKSIIKHAGCRVSVSRWKKPS